MYCRSVHQYIFDQTRQLYFRPVSRIWRKSSGKSLNSVPSAQGPHSHTVYYILMIWREGSEGFLGLKFCPKGIVFGSMKSAGIFYLCGIMEYLFLYSLFFTKVEVGMF